MRRVLCLAILMASCASCGHRGKALNNFQAGVQARVYIKPQKCHDLPAGQYECNHVRFDPVEVRAK